MAQNNRLPCVYVAGPYRAKTRAGIELNIQVARKVGLLASLKGWAVIVPHANTGHLDEVCDLPDQYWLDATMELMRRCDAVVLCPGWDSSAGTQAEIEEATRLGMQIFMTEAHLPNAVDWHTANNNRARA